MVKKLLQSGKVEEAVSYMEDMDDMAEKMSFPCSTNNPVVDILVENSFHGKDTFKKGTGLSNVKKVAEKYGGAMNIETRGDVIILQVLLIIPQHPESISQQMD